MGLAGIHPRGLWLSRLQLGAPRCSFRCLAPPRQSCIGREARAQMLEQAGGLPDVAVACVGGGSNAIGLFHPFVEDKSVRLVGVEAGGEHGLQGKHSATLSGGRPGVLHGTKT